ncbi:MAG: aminoglycoside phosphotransferase family protein [Pseudomonadota bacterium]
MAIATGDTCISGADERRPPLIRGVTRMAVHTLLDRLSRPRPRQFDDVPHRIEAITSEWLSETLGTACGAPPVKDFQIERLTSGTSVRCRIRLDYEDHDHAVANGGAPETIFVKSSPGFLNRVMLGITRTIENEGLFYRHIRELLDIEAPIAYHTAFDIRTGRSAHLLEDIEASKGAIFCTPAMHIDRRQAEDIVTTLARFHSRFLGQADLVTRFPWLKAYPQWFADGYEAFGLKRFHDQAMKEAEAVIPERLRECADDLWEAKIRSLDAHRRMPQTLLHGDVHLGNWYVTETRAMGLCDWQCVTIGCWARDLAYALVACLTIEDRRDWERDLLRLYLEELAAQTGSTISFDEAWLLYRQQAISALMMWTVTLVHSPLMPDMQPRETAIEMIRRASTAMVDLEALECL